MSRLQNPARARAVIAARKKPTTILFPVWLGGGTALRTTTASVTHLQAGPGQPSRAWTADRARGPDWQASRRPEHRGKCWPQLTPHGTASWSNKGRRAPRRRSGSTAHCPSRLRLFQIRGIDWYDINGGGIHGQVKRDGFANVFQELGYPPGRRCTRSSGRAMAAGRRASRVAMLNRSPGARK